jgi:hypothetical protein
MMYQLIYVQTEAAKWRASSRHTSAAAARIASYTGCLPEFDEPAAHIGAITPLTTSNFRANQTVTVSSTAGLRPENSHLAGTASHPRISERDIGGASLGGGLLLFGNMDGSSSDNSCDTHQLRMYQESNAIVRAAFTGR